MPDLASCVVNQVICAMREYFRPDVNPVGGGSEIVRLFAGDQLPLEAWDAHTNDDSCGCAAPFLWVRLMRRYRSESFPQPTIQEGHCSLARVIAVEAGVGRCAAIEMPTSWEAYAQQAEISMDDSWRLESALCRAGQLSNQKECAIRTSADAITPYGPEGGVLAWRGVLYAEIG